MWGWEQWLDDVAIGRGMLASLRDWNKWGKDSFLASAEGTWPCQHLDCGFLVSRTMREYISIVLSHLVYHNFLWQLQETNTNLLTDPREGRNSGSLASCLDPAKLKCSVTHNLSSLPPNQISSAVSSASKPNSLPQGVLLDFHVELSQGSWKAPSKFPHTWRCRSFPPRLLLRAQQFPSKGVSEPGCS